MVDNRNHSDQKELAVLAATGDQDAQRKVNEIAHPLIDFQTNRFCKRYCRQNQYQFRCSLSQPIGSARADASLCEWGNASYGWMLDDLCKSGRLQKFEGRNQASLFDYLYTIANSLPFYERWKDWRFGRRQQVPLYIRELGEQAAAIFYALRLGQSVATMAQTLHLAIGKTEVLINQIVLELTRRHKLFLLNPPHEISLTGSQVDEEDSHQQDVAVDDEAIEVQQQRELLRQCWAELDATEQFVLEAMIIEEQDADNVLKALRTLDISLKKGVSADQTNHQQLYYFKRKTLSRLGILLQGDE